MQPRLKEETMKSEGCDETLEPAAESKEQQEGSMLRKNKKLICFVNIKSDARNTFRNFANKDDR